MEDTPTWLMVLVWVIGALFAFVIQFIWRRRSSIHILRTMSLIPSIIEKSVRHLIASYWAILSIIAVAIVLIMFRFSPVASSNRVLLLDRWTGTVYIVVYPQPYQAEQK